MTILPASLALTCLAQSYSPVADYSSLLMANQYAGNGAIQVERLYVAFPQTEGAYRVVVSEGSKELSSIDYVFNKEAQDVIGRLVPKQGFNGVCLLQRAGTFGLSLQNGSEILTKLEFSIAERTIGDEFTGKKIYVFDGPWRKNAAFVKDPNMPSVKFRIWLSMTEHFGEKTQRAEAVIKKAGVLVAKSRPYVVSSYEWKTFDFGFDKPDGRTALTPADYEKLDGAYEVHLTLDGKAARTFKFSMKKGAMDVDPRSTMGYTPRHLHMLPRTVTSMTNENTSQKIKELYWLPALK